MKEPASQVPLMQHATKEQGNTLTILKKSVASIMASIKDNGEMTIRHMKQLNFFFPDVLAKALKILSQHDTVEYHHDKTSMHGVYTVQSLDGKRRRKHIILQRQYCTCEHFKIKIANNELYCKHLLVLDLALALNQCNVVSATSQEIVDLLNTDLDY